ncbi:MAG: GNAT family N-acetyltransferase [Geminicoccaceae bacterium]
MSLSAPEPLVADHQLDGFTCRQATLDGWLKTRALKNEREGASRTYVVCEGKAVVGYYALAVGSVMAAEAPGKVRRNMPDPIPVMVLGRLAIDQTRQGQGIGSALLRDAIFRTLQAAEIGGMRALMVHAIDDAAARFYEHHGFMRSPIDPATLMITLKDAQKAIR